jgi:hypothetical protein
VGASSPEIERQITETRQHLDANLKVLERRAVSGARKAARVAAVVGIGIVSAAAVGFVAYRLTRDRSPAAVVRDAVPGSFRRLLRGVANAFEHRPRTVKVVVADAGDSRGPSTWRAIAEKVATTIAVSAAGALASRILKRGSSQK